MNKQNLNWTKKQTKQMYLVFKLDSILQFKNVIQGRYVFKYKHLKNATIQKQGVHEPVYAK